MQEELGNKSPKIESPEQDLNKNIEETINIEQNVGSQNDQVGNSGEIQNEFGQVSSEELYREDVLKPFMELHKET